MTGKRKDENHAKHGTKRSKLGAAKSTSASGIDIRILLGCQGAGRLQQSTVCPGQRTGDFQQERGSNSDMRINGNVSGKLGDEAIATDHVQHLLEHAGALPHPSVSASIPCVQPDISHEVPLPLLWARSIRRCSQRPQLVQTTPTGPPKDPLVDDRSCALNEQQHAAATCDTNNPLVIVAGAGTGKTTTLLGRVAHLVHCGAKPRNILLLTFTNNSVDDIARRLAGNLGCEIAQQITCTTIHSFCLAVLRCFGSRLGLGDRVRVAEKTELRAILLEAWQWSALEAERELCAKWIGLDSLGPRSWQAVFVAFREKVPDAFRQCILTPLPGDDPKKSESKAKRQQLAPLESVISASSLSRAFDASPSSLQAGAFQYGYFFFGFKGICDDGRQWWAAAKAFKLQGGPRIRKGAVLQSVEHVHPDGRISQLECDTTLPERLRSILQELPAAQVRVRFEVPDAPPERSPAALRARQDSRWRHFLARAIFLWLRPHQDPEQQTSPCTLTELDGKPKKGELADLLRRISLAKRDGKAPADFLATRAVGCFAFCWTYYIGYMRQAGQVDFHDMLHMAAKLLQNEDVRQIVCAQQRHVLVDEFQDVSEAQFEVVKSLVSNESNRSLSVVGDDDQTIYTWNGSTTSIFNQLQEHCGSGTRLVQLTENYRCSQKILQVGHFALLNNTRRIPKELQPRATWANDEQRCPPPLLWECGTPDDEACAIVDEIEQLLGKAPVVGQFGEHLRSTSCQHPREIAVLFRCFNFKGKAHHPLVRELTRRQVPYFVVRESPFWQQAFAVDLLAYMRLVAGDTGDDGAFLRALAHPPRGCGKGVVDRLREQQRIAEEASGQKKSLEKIVREVLQENAMSHEPSSESRFTLPRNAIKGLQAFVDLITDLRLECATLRVDDAMDFIARHSGYSDWYKRELRKKRKRQKTHGGRDEDQSSDESQEVGTDHEGNEENVENNVPRPRVIQANDGQEEILVSDDSKDDDRSLNGEFDLGYVGLSTENEQGRHDAHVGTKIKEATLPGKIAEAVELAGSFADRWESPLGSTVEVSDSSKVPTLFSICGKRLMAQATGSASVRECLVKHVPASLLDRLTADCGRRGRLQIEDFVAKVALDPKDAAEITRTRRGRRGGLANGPGRGVCISTIHAAKGLEWPVVFVARWNESFLPMSSRIVEELGPNGTKTKRNPTEEEAAEHEEEERRLAHVAVTRAQQRLILTYVRNFSSRKSDPAALSSLPLPTPILPEGDPGAAMWQRVMPKSDDELMWEAAADAAQPQHYAFF